MSVSEKLQELDDNVNHLYLVCLQYYTGLRLRSHPKVNLISEVLDELIVIKKDKEIDGNEYQKRFHEINSKAFNNISEIYDYDKAIEEEKKKNEEIDKALKDKFDVDGIKENPVLDYEGHTPNYG
jgi:hypothetical protein